MFGLSKEKSSQEPVEDPIMGGDLKRNRVTTARGETGEARADLQIFLNQHPEFTPLQNMKDKDLTEALDALQNTSEELKNDFMGHLSHYRQASYKANYEEGRPVPQEPYIN